MHARVYMPAKEQHIANNKIIGIQFSDGNFKTLRLRTCLFCLNFKYTNNVILKAHSIYAIGSACTIVLLLL